MVTGHDFRLFLANLDPDATIPVRVGGDGLFVSNMVFDYHFAAAYLALVADADGTMTAADALTWLNAFGDDAYHPTPVRIHAESQRYESTLIQGGTTYVLASGRFP